MSKDSVGNTRVFIDTSAYYALNDARESEHERAREAMSLLPQYRARLFTTNFIIDELPALVLRRLGGDVALNVIKGVMGSTINLVRVSEEDEQKALAIIETYKDKGFSYTDATSFAVMERLQINTAFTFGYHFKQFGLTILTDVI